MKKKNTKPESFYSVEAFRFMLPGLSKKYVKIEPGAATPLSVDDIIERQNYFNRPAMCGENIIENSARAAKAINTLALLACAGDGKALWQLAEIVSDATDILNKIAETKPDAVKPFARKQVHWPMFRSTAPFLCDDDDLLEKIELGKSLGIQLDRYSKWKVDFASVCAFHLKHHIEFICRLNPIITHARKKTEFSKLLPSFSKDSAPQWWSIAKTFFLATYPKPEDIAKFDALVTAKTKRKFPSTRRAAILEKIQVRFLHLATYPT